MWLRFSFIDFNIEDTTSIICCCICIVNYYTLTAIDQPAVSMPFFENLQFTQHNLQHSTKKIVFKQQQVKVLYNKTAVIVKVWRYSISLASLKSCIGYSLFGFSKIKVSPITNDKTAVTIKVIYGKFKEFPLIYKK